MNKPMNKSITTKVFTGIKVCAVIATVMFVQITIAAEQDAKFEAKSKEGFTSKEVNSAPKKNQTETNSDLPVADTIQTTGDAIQQDASANNNQENGRTLHLNRNAAAVTQSSHQTFTVFDASTWLLRDEDDDGYHQEFSVIFDVDVDYGGADIYAEMYLSLDGETWQHFYTTDIFSIYSDSELDEYEVVTTLVNGYDSNEYDVLFDIYNADTDELVISYSSYDDADLYLLPLESTSLDVYYEPEPAPVVVVSEGHSGNISPWSSLLLFVIAGIRKYNKRLK